MFRKLSFVCVETLEGVCLFDHSSKQTQEQSSKVKVCVLCLEWCVCLDVGWMGNRGFKIFPKVARIQTCLSKDKHWAQICLLVG